MRPAALFVLAAATALLPGAPAQAQQEALVAGHVVAQDGLGVPGALVSFHDAAGGRQAGVLSAEDGAFRARLVPGRYTARVERIGFEVLEEVEVNVPAAGLDGLVLPLRTRAVRIADVVVEPGRSCTVRPDDAAQVGVVWEEARKALAGAAWAREMGALNFRLATWERTFDRDGERVEEERADTAWVRSARPFTAADPETLNDLGWVQEDGAETVFHGPDEGALLSTVFQDNHCFRLRAEGAPLPGLVGLDFEPLEGREKPDIDGVFWLDRASGELRSLEFRYTQVRDERAFPAGGRMTFVRLPTGAWIVRHWSIRVPVYRGSRVARIQEAGGEVLAVDAVPPPPAP